ncbi:hypothetical protein CLV59_104493 [Chitinophaga dinghuensis]|uniref:Uncharacterized protein n=1 Tax=Chitinophaga dinghuensis TaxID=1539050 RepID=A0A327W8A0_9BACT|nr:hypothetical protein CLV59_104493 [Chitinophaga dinghuensis]
MFLVLFCCLASICYAQDHLTAAGYFKEIKAVGLQQPVWHLPLYGPMLLVDPQTRHVFANEADGGGHLTPAGEGVYTGTLPGDVIIANTAITWQGKSWSVIIWPLPTDKEDRLCLMVHESFHRIQDSLGLPAHSPSADHLATMEGRIYFLLELQALKAALNKPVDQRKTDLQNAMVFREKRKQLFPNTFANERILEMNEGLAEYTGVILGRSTANIPGYLSNIIDSTAGRSTIIRSFVYVSGPIYGYLLYQRQRDWTEKVDSLSDFPALIAKYYQLSVPKLPTETQLVSIANRYNGTAITAAEKVKETARLEKVKVYVERFTQQRTLKLKLMKPNVGFNPSNMFDLGAHGTVYPTAEVKDKWGKLTVASNGMLMKDWKVITLSAEGLTTQDNVIQGSGWKIVLEDHWKLLKEDDQHFILQQF